MNDNDLLLYEEIQQDGWSLTYIYIDIYTNKSVRLLSDV